MSHQRLAAILLAIIALAMAGIMVETYWDCRLRGRHSMNECLPGIGGSPGSGISTSPTLR